MIQTYFPCLSVSCGAQEWLGFLFSNGNQNIQTTSFNNFSRNKIVKGPYIVVLTLLLFHIASIFVPSLLQQLEHFMSFIVFVALSDVIFLAIKSCIV